jgi:hypothetical protein
MAEAAASVTGAAAPMIRDRIRELRRVRAAELLQNPKNWRRHPKAQVDALRGVLSEVGYADALLARELPDGRLMLIDGHLRKETTPDALVPVLVLDLDEAEADTLLAVLDPMAGMAETDTSRIRSLLETVRTDNEAALLRRTAGRCCGAPQASSCGASCIHRLSHPRKSTRRPGCRKSGALKPASFGGSVNIGCSVATQPGARTSCG